MRLFPAFAAVLMMLGSPSRAWGPVGHEAVGLIAQNRLSPAALARIQTFLPNASLAQISDCADQFRGGGNANCAGAFTLVGDPAKTKPWHYINIPESAQVDAASLMNYCPNGDCVVAQINKSLEVLKNDQASVLDKQMALMFLVHFVGDAHQPLHAATDVPDDLGGNLKIMRAIRRKPSLHALWDGAIADSHDAASLARLLEADLPNQDAASWTTGSGLAAAAALEGHDIAHTVIYPAYRKSGGSDLLADYQRRMQPIAHRRIQQAGVRLAAMLELPLGP